MIHLQRFLFLFIRYLAESEGFEPPETCASTVFKTAAFDRSASSPARKYSMNAFK
jgi:hypothetical protein